jgi:MYXO-CTERM domain-containing protein
VGDGDCVAGHTCVSSACVASADAGTDTSTADTSVDDTSVTDTSTPDTSIADTSTEDTSTTDGTSGGEDALPDPEKVPRVTGDFKSCGSDSECASGFCVDGVCCDQRCDGKCMTCVLPSSPGKCVAAPFGVDFHHECGADLSCISTCDGKGACTGAGSGTMCSRNVCTGVTTGVGPAYCTGRGEACPTDNVFPFDCAPYTCEKSFGACRTTCQSSDHCGPGYVCDLASARCVNGSAPAEDSGCALSHGAGRSASTAFFVALAAAAIAARRRRTLD